MKLLLHTCCAPCLIFPLEFLSEKGIQVTGYFFNPNIHPFKEFKKRLNCLEEYSNNNDIPLVINKDYGLIEFTRRVAFKEKERCNICYDYRLLNTVILAKKNNFDSFSTTLLYSRYQKHFLIKEKCEDLSRVYNINFFYHDFRVGWQKGIDSSIEENFYRQPYCGCVYSEQERYDNRLKKQLKKKCL